MGVTTIPHRTPRQQHHSWGRQQGQYERPFEQPARFVRHWQLGDIAFLKPEDTFTADEHKTLIQPPPGHRHGYLPSKATGHPVIILSSPTKESTHVLVTPVSAYSSGEDNNYLPPWKQSVHQWKPKEDFRSFYGCERYSEKYPFLYLEGGKSMPKPRASWLYIQSLWALPLTVIGRFTKTRDFLRVRQDSVESLLSHMNARCRQWKDSMSQMEAYERAAKGMPDSSPAGISNWRATSDPPGPYPHDLCSPPATSRRYAPPPSRAITHEASSPPKKSSQTFSYASAAKQSNSNNNNSNNNNSNNNNSNNNNSNINRNSNSNRGSGSNSNSTIGFKTTANNGTTTVNVTGLAPQNVAHHADNIRQPQQKEYQQQGKKLSSKRPKRQPLPCNWRTGAASAVPLL